MKIILLSLTIMALLSGCGSGGGSPANEGASSGNTDTSTRFDIQTASATEGGIITFRVTRSGDTPTAQTIDIATAITASDTASVGDFTANTATLSFSQGQTSQTFNVATLQDLEVEADETFSVLLSNVSAGGEIVTAQVQGVIINNDSASAIVQIILANLDGAATGDTAGIKLNGINGGGSVGDSAGKSVAGIGDVNGDGRVDLLIGAYFDTHSLHSGTGYILFGDSTANLAALTNLTTGFNLAGVNGTNGIALYGSTSNPTGSSAAGGGDYNGDGVSDLLLGEQGFFGIESSYVVYGDGDASDGGGMNDLHGIDVGQLTSGDLNGDGKDDGSVFSSGVNTLQQLVVGDGGDIDNDGLDDILLGQVEADPGAINNAGQAFLVFGSGTGFDALTPLNTDNANAVLVFNGHSSNQFVGRTVKGIGDINDDGFADFLIGATDSSFELGKVYVIFGADRSTLLTLSNNINNRSAGLSNGLDSLNGSNGGFVIQNNPIALRDLLGFSAAALGDFNGDGFDDFSVGAPGQGTAYVIYGKAAGFTNIDLTNDLTGVGSDTGFLNKGFMLGFAQQLGYSISSAGDINGDGYDDLLVGANTASSAYILFGTSNVEPLLSVPDFLVTFNTHPLFRMVDFGADGVRLESGNPLFGAGVQLSGIPGRGVGQSVAKLGDFNGDGFDDVIIGGPNVDPATSINQTDPGSAGQVYVVYGQDFSGVGAARVSANAGVDADRLISGLNADHLSSNGFSEVTLRAGAGNDVLRVNMNERRVDGGSGVDIITPDSAGLALDFAASSNKHRYRNTEQIQLNGFGANTLVVDRKDVQKLRGSLPELLVTGDSGIDTVRSSAQGWIAAGTETRTLLVDNTSSSQSIVFNVYAIAGFHVRLLVQQGINQTAIN